jgi:uncharacterized repeat protein (TIGR01451 family)
MVFLPQPLVTATKSAALQVDADGSGGAGAGDTIRYTVIVTNPVDADALDMTGVVFNDTPGANTTLVAGSVTTSAGVVTTGNAGGDTSVSVEIGTLADGASATITFDVTIGSFLPGNLASVSNQGTVTGDNIAATVTDNPATPAPGDATVTPMEGGVAVPSSGTTALIVLGLALATIALTRLRLS